MLSKSLDDVDASVINGNYALQAGLKTKDAIFTEGPESPYANVLVVREGDENKPSIIKLKNALQSEAVRKFILDTYQGEIVPAF